MFTYNERVQVLQSWYINLQVSDGPDDIEVSIHCILSNRFEGLEYALSVCRCTLFRFASKDSEQPCAGSHYRE